MEIRHFAVTIRYGMPVRSKRRYSLCDNVAAKGKYADVVKATSDGKVFPDNKHSVSFVRAGVICCTATPLNNLSVYLHNQGNSEGGICPTIYPPYVCAGKERVYVLQCVVVQCAVSVYENDT